MKRARDVMDPNPLTVSPAMSVSELARLLHERRLDGVCVVQGDQLVGVVTTMDLIFKEKRLHLPTVFFFLDAVIPLENPLKSVRELEKIAGDHVEGIMTREPYSVGPDAPLEEVASLMVDNHLTIVPVVEEGRVLGTVTKPAMLRAAFGLA